jgi:phosphohistidine phosphatase SixA
MDNNNPILGRPIRSLSGWIKRGWLRDWMLLAVALLIGGCNTWLPSNSLLAVQMENMAVPPSITEQPSAESGTALPTSTPADTPLPTLPAFTPTTEPSPTIARSPLLVPFPELTGETLVNALRRGGYVIYFRHATTDRSQTDTQPQNLDNCQKQRNLNEQGRVEARTIGESLASLSIPIGRVLSSGYCRARETAQLAFGQAVITPDLTGFPQSLRDQRIAALARMLSTRPLPRTNTVLVAHGFNLTNTADITISEGEAAVFAPIGAGRFALVARIQPEGWVELAQLFRDPAEVLPTPLQTDASPSPQPTRTATTQQADSALLLPDLQTLPPSDLRMQVNTATGQKQLRFTNSIQNSGPGALELLGVFNATTGRTTVTQHIFTSNGSFEELVAGEFIFHQGHDHWHLENFARYEIRSLTPDGNFGSVEAYSDKISYCLRDDSRAENLNVSTRPAYTDCKREVQGITAGWVDIYRYHLQGQDIVITGIPDGVCAPLDRRSGRFTLEVDDTNNAATVYFQISGSAYG